MECINCNKSVINHAIILHRVNEMGVVGEWMCEDCMKIHEPELLKNSREGMGDFLEVFRKLKKSYKK